MALPNLLCISGPAPDRYDLATDLRASGLPVVFLPPTWEYSRYWERASSNSNSLFIVVSEKPSLQMHNVLLLPPDLEPTRKDEYAQAARDVQRYGAHRVKVLTILSTCREYRVRRVAEWLVRVRHEADMLDMPTPPVVA